MSELDWTAFRAPVSRQEVQTWKAAAQRSGHRWADSGTARTVTLLVLLVPMVALFAILGIVLVVGGIVELARGGPGTTFSGSIGVVVGSGFSAISALAVWGLTKALPDERRWERWLRLDWFARTNRLTFSPADPDPDYPGAIFRNGGTRHAIDHFRSTEGRFFDVGNFRYVIRSSRSSTTITWGFLALSLERRLPHMLLDSIQNNSWASAGLAGLFARDQVLSLEGDFDRWFTLYCPKQYETDALYVFTPDLMALCIDNVAPFDVEIVDDWMFVYSPRAFRMDDPALLHRLFRIVDVVGSKALRQTARYRDEKAAVPFPANVVAVPGRRLRRRFPVAAIVLLAAILGVPVLAGLLGVLGAVIATLAGR